MAPENSPLLPSQPHLPKMHQATKTELGVKRRDGSFILLISVSNALCSIHLGVLFFLSFSISLSPHVEEEEEEEEKEESSLCEMPRCSQSIVLLAVRLN